MNELWNQFHEGYFGLLRDYLAGAQEAALQQAYELGRTGIAGGLGVLDMARIHQAALRDLLQEPLPGVATASLVCAGETFFLEALSPFEAAHRGFREANSKLQQLIATLEDRNTHLAVINEQLETEIAERKRLEEMWKRYEAIVNNSRDWMTLISTDCTFAAVNDAYCEAHQMKREDLVGSPVQSVWGEASFYQTIKPHLERCFAGQDVHYEAWITRRSHRCYDVSYYPYWRDGQVTHVIVVTRDVTERKLAEDRLNRSQMMLAEAQQIAHLGSWDWDVARNVVTWSDELYRIYGLEPQQFEATCEAFLNCLHPDDRDRIAQTIRQCLETHQPFSTHERIVRPNGDVRILHSIGQVAVDEQGRPTRLHGTCQDVTDLKRAEEALRQSEEHYRQLFHEACTMQESLRHLSNKMLHVQEEERKRFSHELHDEVGQALTAINMNLTMLCNQGRAAPGELHKRLLDAQNLVIQTMDTVHRFARELRPAILDDLGLLPALRSFIRDFSERTGLRVRFNAAVSAEQLDAERKTVVYRIAQESLNNVAKHACASAVEVNLRCRNNRVFLEIKDNGQSFRVPAPQAQKRLGLLGMEERVRLVGGVFSIQPQPGIGTTIRIEIPFPAPAGPATPTVPDPLVINDSTKPDYAKNQSPIGR